MPIQSQQLHSFYNHALEWIDQNITLFNPLAYENTSQTSSLYQAKALGELGLLCMLYSRYEKGALDSRVKHFLLFIHSIWQHLEYRERIVRRPAYFQIYTMIYVVLQQCNIIDDSYKETIQRTLDQGYVTATETTPMRLLDRRHMLDCGHFLHNLPSYEELYEQTLLAKTPSVIYLTDSDVYAITHTLFYFTDFGRYSTASWNREHLLTVHWMVKTLLGLYLRRKHWDLVGELLLTCQCLHWYPKTIFELSWETMMKFQLPDGSIPGPRYSDEQALKIDGEDKRQYCFEQNYHTTIVNAIAGFLTYHWMEYGSDGSNKG